MFICMDYHEGDALKEKIGHGSRKLQPLGRVPAP
jgi:hypothetical protein